MSPKERSPFRSHDKHHSADRDVLDRFAVLRRRHPKGVQHAKLADNSASLAGGKVHAERHARNGLSGPVQRCVLMIQATDRTGPQGPVRSRVRMKVQPGPLKRPPASSTWPRNVAPSNWPTIQVPPKTICNPPSGVIVPRNPPNRTELPRTLKLSTFIPLRHLPPAVDSTSALPQYVPLRLTS